jgi:hypothetical protein
MTTVKPFHMVFSCPAGTTVFMLSIRTVAQHSTQTIGGIERSLKEISEYSSLRPLRRGNRPFRTQA